LEGGKVLPKRLLMRLVSPLFLYVHGDGPDDVAAKYKVETKVVAIDVSKPEERETGFAKMEELAKTLDIGILGTSPHLILVKY
jgi:hypothetical protein